MPSSKLRRVDSEGLGEFEKAGTAYTYEERVRQRRLRSYLNTQWCLGVGAALAMLGSAALSAWLTVIRVELLGGDVSVASLIGVAQPGEDPLPALVLHTPVLEAEALWPQNNAPVAGVLANAAVLAVLAAMLVLAHLCSRLVRLQRNCRFLASYVGRAGVLMVGVPPALALSGNLGFLLAPFLVMVAFLNCMWGCCFSAYGARVGREGWSPFERGTRFSSAFDHGDGPRIINNVGELGADGRGGGGGGAKDTLWTRARGPPPKPPPRTHVAHGR